MTDAIGISSGHLEWVREDNLKAKPFLGALRLEGRPWVDLTEPFRPETLAQYGAILIGMAHTPFTPDETQALHDWVASGGRLLVLGVKPTGLPRLRPFQGPCGQPFWLAGVEWRLRSLAR